MINKLAVLLAAVLFAPMTTYAATLAYELEGELDFVFTGSPWPIGTPFVIRVSYDPASMQVAEIFGDFPAHSVVAHGDFTIGPEPVLSFTDSLLWQYDAYSRFELSLGMHPTTAQPLDPTVSPEDSNLDIYFSLPDGFLTDGSLFDSSRESVVPVSGHMTFDDRSRPDSFGWGDPTLIRLVPEPGTFVMSAMGLLVLLSGRWTVARHAGGQASKSSSGTLIAAAGDSM